MLNGSSIASASDEAAMNKPIAPVAYETTCTGDRPARAKAWPPKNEVTSAVAASIVPARDRRLSTSVA